MSRPCAVKEKAQPRVSLWRRVDAREPRASHLLLLRLPPASAASASAQQDCLNEVLTIGRSCYAICRQPGSVARAACGGGKRSSPVRLARGRGASPGLLLQLRVAIEGIALRLSSLCGRRRLARRRASDGGRRVVRRLPLETARGRGTRFRCLWTQEGRDELLLVDLWRRRHGGRWRERAAATLSRATLPTPERRIKRKSHTEDADSKDSG